MDATDTAYAVATGVATVSGALHHRSLAALSKPVPMAILAWQAVRTARRRRPIDNALLAGAIVFSAAGDRAMLVEEFTPHPEGADRASLTLKDRRLRIGASLFAGAQLCLTGAMLRRGARPQARPLLLRTAILAESALVVAIHRPRLLPVLGAYGNTLATMSATAAGMPSPQPQMRAGGWFFLLSDLTILNRRHLIDDSRAAMLAETWVLASYFTAQRLLIGGLIEQDGQDRSGTSALRRLRLPDLRKLR